jgi:hypothetical protein
MKWREFKEAAPEIAESAENLFDKTGVLILGTLRKDGSPRISPVEFVFVDGDLQLGMMPRSFKVRDLRRDPRCSIHSTVTDRMASDGEFKAHGHAIDIEDPVIRRRYGQALYEKIGWNPEGMPYALFSIEIATAAFFIAEKNERLVRRWRAGETPHEFRQGMEGGDEEPE